MWEGKTQTLMEIQMNLAGAHWRNENMWFYIVFESVPIFLIGFFVWRKPCKQWE